MLRCYPRRRSPPWPRRSLLPVSAVAIVACRCCRLLRCRPRYRPLCRPRCRLFLLRRPPPTSPPPPQAEHHRSRRVSPRPLLLPRPPPARGRTASPPPRCRRRRHRDRGCTASSPPLPCLRRWAPAPARVMGGTRRWHPRCRLRHPLCRRRQRLGRERRRHCHRHRRRLLLQLARLTEVSTLRRTRYGGWLQYYFVWFERLFRPTMTIEKTTAIEKTDSLQYFFYFFYFLCFCVFCVLIGSICWVLRAFTGLIFDLIVVLGRSLFVLLPLLRSSITGCAIISFFLSYIPTTTKNLVFSLAL